MAAVIRADVMRDIGGVEIPESLAKLTGEEGKDGAGGDGNGRVPTRDVTPVSETPAPIATNATGNEGKTQA